MHTASRNMTDLLWLFLSWSCLEEGILNVQNPSLRLPTTMAHPRQQWSSAVPGRDIRGHHAPGNIGTRQAKAVF